MSRVRLVYALAFFGILITTGGCANSATAPEAASVERTGIGASRSSAASDSTQAKPEKDDGITIQSGYISVGN